MSNFTGIILINTYKIPIKTENGMSSQIHMGINSTSLSRNYDPDKQINACISIYTVYSIREYKHAGYFYFVLVLLSFQVRQRNAWCIYPVMSRIGGVKE